MKENDVSVQSFLPETPNHDTSIPYGKGAGLKELAKHLDLEEKEFSELVSLFLETGTAELNKIRFAVAEGDASKAFHGAHSLKGTAVTLGLNGIYELAKEIEKNAHRNNLNGTEERVGAIQEEFNRIRDLLT